MANSRLITAADLTTADFDDVADDWATSRGLIASALNVTAASANITNNPAVLYVMNSGSAQSLTLPADLTNIPINGIINIFQRGVGLATIVEGSGVTILKSSSTLTIGEQYKRVQLLKLDTNEWVALGDFT